MQALQQLSGGGEDGPAVNMWKGAADQATLAGGYTTIAMQLKSQQSWLPGSCLPAEARMLLRAHHGHQLAALAAQAQAEDRSLTKDAAKFLTRWTGRRGLAPDMAAHPDAAAAAQQVEAVLQAGEHCGCAARERSCVQRLADAQQAMCDRYTAAAAAATAAADAAATAAASPSSEEKERKGAGEEEGVEGEEGADAGDVDVGGDAGGDAGGDVGGAGAAAKQQGVKRGRSDATDATPLMSPELLHSTQLAAGRCRVAAERLRAKAATTAETARAAGEDPATATIHRPLVWCPPRLIQHAGSTKWSLLRGTLLWGDILEGVEMEEADTEPPAAFAAQGDEVRLVMRRHHNDGGGYSDRVVALGVVTSVRPRRVLIRMTEEADEDDANPGGPRRSRRRQAERGGRTNNGIDNACYSRSYHWERVTDATPGALGLA